MTAGNVETLTPHQVEEQKQEGRIIPYLPYPVFVSLGTAEATIGGQPKQYVVLEFQDQGGDRAYFLEPEMVTVVMPKALKLARGLMVQESQRAKLVSPTGEALIK